MTRPGSAVLPYRRTVPPASAWQRRAVTRWHQRGGFRVASFARASVRRLFQSPPGQGSLGTVQALQQLCFQLVCLEFLHMDLPIGILGVQPLPDSSDEVARAEGASVVHRTTRVTWRMARIRRPAASAASRRVKARGTRGARRVLRYSTCGRDCTVTVRCHAWCLFRQIVISWSPATFTSCRSTVSCRHATGELGRPLDGWCEPLETQIVLRNSLIDTQ